VYLRGIQSTIQTHGGRSGKPGKIQEPTEKEPELPWDTELLTGA